MTKRRPLSAILLLVPMIVAASEPLPLKAGDGSPSPEQIEKLRQIGKEVSTALLQKDVEGVLRYDRPDLILEDRGLLRDTKSDLYCYLFDTACLRPKATSIYAKLHGVKDLGIATKAWGKAGDGSPSFLLIFYDRAKLTREKALSDKVLCAQAGGGSIVTWTFRYARGAWESVTPPFDAEGDGLCSSE